MARADAEGAMFSLSSIMGVFIAGGVLILLAALLIAVRGRIQPAQAANRAGSHILGRPELMKGQ